MLTTPIKCDNCKNVQKNCSMTGKYSIWNNTRLLHSFCSTKCLKEFVDDTWTPRKSHEAHRYKRLKRKIERVKKDFRKSMDRINELI